MRRRRRRRCAYTTTQCLQNMSNIMHLADCSAVVSLSEQKLIILITRRSPRRLQRNVFLIDSYGCARVGASRYIYEPLCICGILLNFSPSLHHNIIPRRKNRRSTYYAFNSLNPVYLPKVFVVVIIIVVRVIPRITYSIIILYRIIIRRTVVAPFPLQTTVRTHNSTRHRLVFTNLN